MKGIRPSWSNGNKLLYHLSGLAARLAELEFELRVRKRRGPQNSAGEDYRKTCVNWDNDTLRGLVRNSSDLILDARP